jgi:tripartite-type tricarboxylate transporter receptor subunit TctC
LETSKAGRIRVLATSGRERSTALPEVPTFTESGYAIRGEGGYGIYAPAKTPADFVAQLNPAVVEAVRTAEFSKRLTPLGVQTTGTSAEEFSKIQKSDSELWDRWSRLPASSRSNPSAACENGTADRRVSFG